MTPLATLRTLVKSVEPEARVSYWDGEFTVRVHHEVRRVEQALASAGYVRTRRDDTEGGRHDWWTIMTVAKGSGVSTRGFLPALNGERGRW